MRASVHESLGIARPFQFGVLSTGFFQPTTYRIRPKVFRAPALNVLDGTVIGRNMQRHRHQEFIRFLNTIEANVPKRKDIHAIVDGVD
jgi:hypothetical protein